MKCSAYSGQGLQLSRLSIENLGTDVADMAKTRSRCPIPQQSTRRVILVSRLWAVKKIGIITAEWCPLIGMHYHLLS